MAVRTPVKIVTAKVKGPGVAADCGRPQGPPGPCHFNKEQTPLEIYSIPTRGFTAAVSVFRGTPPAKPLECKFWLNTTRALLCDRWADPTGGEPRLSCAYISFVSIDII